MEQRTCPVCRRAIPSPKANQRFCPPTQEQRDRGIIHSKCAKAYINAKKRGSLDKLLAELWTPPAPFDCATCGQHCVPGENVAAHAKKFCGQDCKGEWHRTLDPNGRYAAAKEREAERWQRDAPKRKRAKRRRDARRRLDLAAQGMRGVKPWYNGTCPYCGKQFTTKLPQQRQCGHQRCTSKSRYESDSQKGKNLNARGRHATRKTGARYEPINRDVVYDRDKYVCGLCGNKTDPEAPHCAPQSPSIDHIVPLSRGGDHTYENVQCACFECNWVKGDDPIGPMAGVPPLAA